MRIEGETQASKIPLDYENTRTEYECSQRKVLTTNQIVRTATSVVRNRNKWQVR